MKKLTKIATLAAVLLVAFSALAFATTAQTAEEAGKNYNELTELMFDGYDEMSVGEYRAWLDEIGIDLDSLFQREDDVWYETRYDDFLFYVLEPLTSENFMVQGSWTRDGSGGAQNLDTGEYAEMNYRITCQALDLERLTVGRLRDSLKMIWEGIQSLDILSATQEELQERANDLAQIGSDGETIAFSVLVELVDVESPYSDPQTRAKLEEYAALGLEYEYILGELTMRYQGHKVDGIWDAAAGSITANSTGPKGVGGGSILEVVYEDGQPVELRFIEE